ncbi:membrane-associating domain-containing protein [Xylariomycetidae sp. FL2044]|nr:membrane-associating domain-containing protein [Xylariomycetidae sp. FL2044]
MPSSSIVILGLRAAQMLFAIIIMGLSAYVANWYNVDTLTSSPSQINFLLASSLLTIVSVLYLELTPRFMPRASHPYAAMGLELLNALFYFAGFIALAVFISGLLFCRGSVCGAAKADVAFGAFEFLLWTGSSLLMGKDVFKGGVRLPTRGARSQAPLNVPPPMKENPAVE